MQFDFLDPWDVFLPRDPGHVVAVSGSGGKSTLVGAIARLWAAEGRPALATTTTRTEPLADFVPATTDAAARSLPAGLPVFRHDGVRPDGKWQGLSPDKVDRLEESLPGRLVVAEVDGAAKRPFKYYRVGEPAWPRRTSLALVVMGTGGVGERAGDVVHRLGRDDVADPVGVTADEVWQWDHAHALLTGPGGYLAQVPPTVPVVLVLAGLEQQPDSVGLFGFVARAMAHPRLPLVVFCSRDQDGPVLRTACRREEPPPEATGADTADGGVPGAGDGRQ